MKFIEQMSLELENISKEKVLDCTNMIKSCERIYIYGNGGSAGIASHLSVDFTKAVMKPCMTFYDPSLVTCFSNDYGFENYVQECIKNFVSYNDAVILISSSGTSKNVLKAADYCFKNKISCFSLSGFSPNNPLTKVPSKGHFHVNSDNYNIVEATHLLFLLAVIEQLREEL